MPLTHETNPVIERLLIPAWNAPARSVDDWNAQLEQLGDPPVIDRRDPEELWIVLDPIGTRLLAVMEGSTLVALHAEIDGPDPSNALDLLGRAADALDWEVHETEDEDDEGA
ncbi:hypothetical protein AB1L88_00545 [Tautonia sp. JC769]|uniref:hypothetical protein n=1 Tax=Tautonia sp. JC769 TaxID=3232135 RepID=UPI00345A33FC